MAEWFYVQNGQQAGPVEASQLMQLLATGRLNRDDLVWREGMANWAAAQSVPELCPAPVQMPAAAPMYASPVGPAGFPNAAATLPYPTQAPMPGGYPQYGAALPQSGAGMASLIIGIIAAVLIFLGIIFAVVMAAGGQRNPASPGLILSGLGLILGLVLSVVGVIVGFVGLSPTRKRLPGILGLVINGGILLLGGGLLLIGMLAR